MTNDDKTIEIADELFKEFVEHDLIEDRMEYDIDDFMSSYDVAHDVALVIFTRLRYMT